MSGAVLGNLGATDGVGIRAEPNSFGWLMIDHMTDSSPTTWDIGETHERLGSCVESDEAIGVRAGFHEPHPVLIIDGHPVWLGIGFSWRQPFLNIASFGIVGSKIPFGIIDIPNDAVRGDRQSSWSCFGP